MYSIYPLIPHFYVAKLGYPGCIPILLNFAPKHILCVLIRSASSKIPTINVLRVSKNKRTIGPQNAHLKPDLGVLSHHYMTLTLNTHTPLLT